MPENEQSKSGPAYGAEAPPIINSVPGVEPVDRTPEPPTESEVVGEGIRTVREPGRKYEPGMHFDVSNPQHGDPQVPNLGPGDPRGNQNEQN